MAAGAGAEAALELASAPFAGACGQAAEEGLLAQTAEEGLLAQPPELAFGVESDGDGGAGSPRGAAGGPAAGTRGGRWRGLRRPRALLAAGALGAAVLLGCAAAGAGLQRRASAGPEEGNLGGEVELGALDSMLSVMGTFADGVDQASQLSDNINTSYHALKDMAGQLNSSADEFAGIGGELYHQLNDGPKRRQELIAKFKALNTTQKAKVKAKLFKRFNISSWKDLRPKASSAHMHDGNVCQSDEEEFQELCYKRCGLLTRGHFPYRVSAWECCQHPGACTENYRIDFRLCGGFGAAGDEVGGGCPHTLGGCLKSEELYGNLCYKRCALLSYGILSDRAGPNTCCKSGHATSMLAFMDIGACETKSDYFLGGGGDDGDSNTPAAPHLPMKRFTEAES